MYVLLIVVCPFVLFLLAIVLSVLLRYTDSDCPFGIFKLFFLFNDYSKSDGCIRSSHDLHKTCQHLTFRLNLLFVGFVLLNLLVFCVHSVLLFIVCSLALFGRCVVSLSSIWGVWIPLGYLKTCLIMNVYYGIL
jgi:hypothetical protein